MGSEMKKQKPERIKLKNEEFLAIENILLKKGLEAQRVESARAAVAQLNESERNWMVAVAKTRNIDGIEQYGLDIDKRELILRTEQKVK